MYILSDLRAVLVMSVNPGGGQRFIPSSLRKLAELPGDAGAARGLTDQVAIAIDSGITGDNCAEVVAAGPAG